MPVDYRKYPPNFKSEIRPRILKRAGNKCERCGVPNYALGYWQKSGTFRVCDGMELEAATLDGEKIIKIILTIAHTHDPDPMNCSDDNLQALCQKHHNQLDAPMRAKHAAETRAKKKHAQLESQGQMALLLEES